MVYDVFRYYIDKNLLVECLCECSITEVLIDVCNQKSPIPVISDVTAIVDPSDKILEGIPWCLVIFIQVDTQQIL